MWVPWKRADGYYDNIRKAIQFLLGSNMSEVLSIFISTLMGFTILKPVHLLWINLVTDCFPALALGMEKAEPDIMRRKPRSAKAGVFAGGMGFDVAYQGVLVTVLVLASYFIGHFMEAGVWEITNSADGMTMAFLTMSMAEIFHSFNMRSQRGSIFALKTFNKALMIAAVGSLVATTVVCEVPFIANAFGFETVEFSEYAVAIGSGRFDYPLGGSGQAAPTQNSEIRNNLCAKPAEFRLFYLVQPVFSLCGTPSHTLPRARF